MRLVTALSFIVGAPTAVCVRNYILFIRNHYFSSKGRSVNAEVEAELWRLAADKVMDALYEQYATQKISAKEFHDFVNKLGHWSSNVFDNEFKARNWQTLLKQQIVARRGTKDKKMQPVSVMPFPDRVRSNKRKLAIGVK